MFHWTQRVDEVFHTRYMGTGCTVTAVNHKVYTFQQVIYTSDYAITEAHVFNTVSLRWRSLSKTTQEGFYGDVPRRTRPPNMSLTAVPIEHVVYVWGGERTSPPNNVLLAFDVDADHWSKPEVFGSVPHGRENHSACALGKVMFIHGGKSGRRQGDHTVIFHSDTYKLDTSTMVWSLVITRGTPPPPSARHSATIIGTKMFVFGGETCAHQSSIRLMFHNHIRVFDIENNLWLSTAPFAQFVRGRKNNSNDNNTRWLLGAFAYNGELYVTFSLNRELTSSDVWRFSPESLSWTRVEPKGNFLLDTALTCNPTHCCMLGEDRVVLFGHFGGSGPMDLQILDLSPSLKTLCKMALIQHGLDLSGLPHDIIWELKSMIQVQI